MKLMLATLCLNEMEWLPKLYEQHKDWPGVEKWVFVESADKVYAEASPGMVSSQGLSMDGTTQYLESIDAVNLNIMHIEYGVSKHSDPAQGKCESRSMYLTVADDLKPDFIIVLDADEFYPKAVQSRISDMLSRLASVYTGMVVRQRHIWRPPILVDEPLFKHEVQGGFWDIPHCRIWRWSPGIRYVDNHNSPQRPDRYMLNSSMIRLDRRPRGPECVHMGYAASIKARHAKHRYYEARGEGTDKDPKRKWYTESRAAWETWKPGDVLPRKAEVKLYTGEIPEVFK